MSGKFVRRGTTAALAMCAFLLLSGAVAGATAITVSPMTLKTGEPVVITIRDLPDGSRFTLHLTGSFAASPGSDFTFGAADFEMPFTLNNATVTAKMSNTDYNILSVQKGDTEVRAMGSSTNGQFSESRAMTIGQGMYDYFLLAGTAAPGANRVVAELDLSGIKQGPADSTIRFGIDGIDQGSVTVQALVDGVTVLSETIAVGTTAASTGSQSGGSSGTSSPQGTTAPAETAPNLLEDNNGSPTTTLTGADPTGGQTSVPASPATSSRTSLPTSMPTTTKTALPGMIAVAAVAGAALVVLWRR